MNPNTEAAAIVSELLNSWIDSVVPTQLHVAEHSDLDDLIPHQYHQNYKVKQGKCYQQHSPNLCGYHAVFNSICFLQLLRGGHCQYHIEKCSHFWRLKLHVQQLLVEYKKDKAMPDEWPWRNDDIRNGDFQRTYHQICSQSMKEFFIFHNQDSFQYLTHTWSFQYSNLLLDEDSRKMLSHKITKFRQCTAAQPMVLHLMLGITTHWLVFFAVKTNDKIDYWFFDSQNDIYLDLDAAGIKNLIEKQSMEAYKSGKKQYTAFQKETYAVCIKDIQESLKLIVNCLEGEATLEGYDYNRKFSIFANKLKEAMSQNADSISKVIREYQFNIMSFLIESIQWQLFHPENADLLREIAEYAGNNKEQSEELKFLHELLEIQCQQPQLSDPY